MAITFKGRVTKVSPVWVPSGPVWACWRRTSFEVTIELVSGAKVRFRTPEDTESNHGHWEKCGICQIKPDDILTVRGTVISRVPDTIINRVRKLSHIITTSSNSEPKKVPDDLFHWITIYEEALSLVSQQKMKTGEALEVLLEARKNLTGLQNLLDTHLARLEDHVAFLENKVS